jgi:hypothetical protein
MHHAEFRIGTEFTSADRTWRCTDTGERTICAIRLDAVKVAGTSPELDRVLNRKEAEADGWFKGPPYPVSEIVFDEDDMPACELIKHPRRKP